MELNERNALLLRHADRDSIPEGSFGNEIQLNETGKLNAYEYGVSLQKEKVNKIFTSPVERCVQTAEFITKGYGRSVEIIETKALGAPGLHISDERMAGEFYLEFGFDEMYSRLINGMEIPGIPKLHEINQRIINFLNENTTQNGKTLFITHDMLIVFFHFSINNRIYTKDNWVDYLSGLTFKNGKIDEG